MEGNQQRTSLPDPERADKLARYIALAYRIAQRVRAEQIAASMHPSGSSGEPLCK
jgi:hypothetical protein